MVWYDDDAEATCTIVHWAKKNLIQPTRVKGATESTAVVQPALRYGPWNSAGA